MHAKQPRFTSPPSRTRTQRLFGTSAYQIAFSASRQMPPGTRPSRSAQARRFERPPSAAMSKAVSFLPWDSARISVELSGVTAMPIGERATIRYSPDRAVRSNQCDCISCVDVSVSPAVHDNFVPGVAREDSQIGMINQRTALLFAEQQ